MNCSYRDFTCAVLNVFRRLTLACCMKRMYQEKQVFALFCFVALLIAHVGQSGVNFLNVQCRYPWTIYFAKEGGRVG